MFEDKLINISGLNFGLELIGISYDFFDNGLAGKANHFALSRPGSKFRGSTSRRIDGGEDNRGVEKYSRFFTRRCHP